MIVFAEDKIFRISNHTELFRPFTSILFRTNYASDKGIGRFSVPSFSASFMSVVFEGESNLSPGFLKGHFSHFLLQPGRPLYSPYSRYIFYPFFTFCFPRFGCDCAICHPSTTLFFGSSLPIYQICSSHLRRSFGGLRTFYQHPPR